MNSPQGNGQDRALARHLFVADLDGCLAAAAERGVVPKPQETYGNGVRKATFADPDGNEVGLGGRA